MTSTPADQEGCSLSQTELTSTVLQTLLSTIEKPDTMLRTRLEEIAWKHSLAGLGSTSQFWKTEFWAFGSRLIDFLLQQKSQSLERQDQFWEIVTEKLQTGTYRPDCAASAIFGFQGEELAKCNTAQREFFGNDARISRKRMDAHINAMPPEKDLTEFEDEIHGVGEYCGTAYRMSVEVFKMVLKEKTAHWERRFRSFADEVPAQDQDEFWKAVKVSACSLKTNWTLGLSQGQDSSTSKYEFEEQYESEDTGYDSSINDYGSEDELLGGCSSDSS
jgi:hypothetical protein